MKIQHTGQEDIPVGIEKVWQHITDPNWVASCLPDVQEVTVRDERNFDAVVKVGLGPVRGNFKFKIELQPDAANNKMNVKISGGGLGSAVDLVAGADLKANGDNTLLDWNGEATMRGPVAAVGGRVLDAQAQKLISQTFANMREKLSV